MNQSEPSAHKETKMALSTDQKVGNFAFYSRILVLVMQIFFNYLIPDHDAKVFNPPIVHTQYRLDSFIEAMLGGFRRWDAVYFIHIAEHGYSYENISAFFPLFPIIVRTLANTIFFPLQYIMNYTNVLLVAAFVFNTVCFIQTAKLLHSLALKIMQDEGLAMKVVHVFCINPASIFFSAAYSEASFALFTFAGMLKLENHSYLSAALFFALSSGTRSNGLINIGFIWYKKGHVLVDLLVSTFQSNQTRLYTVIKSILSTFLCLIMYTIIIVTPYVAYQYYLSNVFCNPHASYADLKPHILNYGNNQHYKMAHTGISFWCQDTPPFSYSYVQSTYWNVGFLNYYQFKQIPNFALAAPVVLIGISALFMYFWNNPIYCLTLGLYQNSTSSEYKKTDIHTRTRMTYGFNSKQIFVHLVHMTALITFGMLFMHVQVLTRFICSSCPVFYFFLAWVTTPEDQLHTSQFGPQSHSHRVSSSLKNGKTERLKTQPMLSEAEKKETFSALMDWENTWINKVVYFYLHLYLFVGIAAFSNFLPWT